MEARGFGAGDVFDVPRLAGQRFRRRGRSWACCTISWRQAMFDFLARWAPSGMRRSRARRSPCRRFPARGVRHAQAEPDRDANLPRPSRRACRRPNVSSRQQQLGGLRQAHSRRPGAGGRRHAPGYSRAAHLVSRFDSSGPTDDGTSPTAMTGVTLPGTPAIIVGSNGTWPGASPTAKATGSTS